MTGRFVIPLHEISLSFTEEMGCVKGLGSRPCLCKPSPLHENNGIFQKPLSCRNLSAGQQNTQLNFTQQTLTKCQCTSKSRMYSETPSNVKLGRRLLISHRLLTSYFIYSIQRYFDRMQIQANKKGWLPKLKVSNFILAKVVMKR